MESSAFRTMRGVRSFSFFIWYRSTIFQWMKLVLAPLSTRAFLVMLRFPFLDLSSTGTVNVYLLGRVVHTNRSLGSHASVRSHVARREPSKKTLWRWIQRDNDVDREETGRETEQ